MALTSSQSKTNFICIIKRGRFILFLLFKKWGNWSSKKLIQLFNSYTASNRQSWDLKPSPNYYKSFFSDKMRNQEWKRKGIWSLRSLYVALLLQFQEWAKEKSGADLVRSGALGSELLTPHGPHWMLVSPRIPLSKSGCGPGLARLPRVPHISDPIVTTADGNWYKAQATRDMRVGDQGHRFPSVSTRSFLPFWQGSGAGTPRAFAAPPSACPLLARVCLFPPLILSNFQWW